MKKRLFLLVLAVLMLFATTATPVDASDFFICYETLSPDKDSYYLGETIRIHVTYSGIEDISKITSGSMRVEYNSPTEVWYPLGVFSYDGFDFEYTADKAGEYWFTINGVTVSEGDYLASEDCVNVTVLEPFVPKTEFTVFFASNGHGGDVEDQIVEAGEIAVKPEDPSEDGWNFEGWYEDATLKYKFDFSTIIGTNTHLYAKWTKAEASVTESEKAVPSYKCIEGENVTWTKGSAEGLTVVSDAPIDKFVNAEINGKTLDTSRYTVVSGSTRITLKPDYLETLDEGKHTIEIISTDGSVKTNFTIKAAPSSSETAKDNPDKTPKTGNNGLPFVLGALFIFGTAFAGTVYSKKK